MFVVGLLIVLSGMAVPQVLVGIDRSRAAAAARYLAQQCGAARMSAVARSAAVAIRFRQRDGEFEIQTFLDRNGNGVRTADIESGVDTALTSPEPLRAKFPGVTIGLAPGVGLGPDPVRLGAADLMSFTPVGTSSTGSIYVMGRDGSQFVVRVLGVTGRTRVQRYDASRRVWVDP